MSFSPRLIVLVMSASWLFPGIARCHDTDRFYDVTVAGPWNNNTPADPNNAGWDETAILDTIEYARQYGGVVYIPPAKGGEYKIKQSLEIPDDDGTFNKEIAIVGAGWESLIAVYRTDGGIASPDFSAIKIGDTRTSWTPEISRCAIRSLRIVSKNLIQNSTADNGGVGIDIQGAQSCLFSDIAVFGFEFGIKVHQGSAGNYFQNVETIGAGNTCLWIQGDTSSSESASWRWLTDNRFVSCKATGIPGLSWKPENAVKIEGKWIGDQFFINLFANTCGTGVKIAGLSGAAGVNYTSNFLFSGLVTDQCDNYSVLATDVRDIRISDAVAGIVGFAFSGCDDVQIANSNILGDALDESHATGNGINFNVSGMTGGCSRPSVLGCRVANFRYGITLTNSRFGTIQGNRIHAPTDTTPKIGIRLAETNANQTKHNLVAGNVIYGMGPGEGSAADLTYGIMEQADAGTTYTYNRISHNVIDATTVTVPVSAQANTVVSN